MIDDHDLMRLHVQTLFTHNQRGDLVTVNDAGSRPAPRFFMGITRHGAVRRFRVDVDSATRTALIELSDRHLSLLGALDVLEHLVEYHTVLTRAAPVQRSGAGPAFQCPIRFMDSASAVRISETNSYVLKRHLEAWIPDVQAAQPMFAVLLHGEAVAVCASVRKSESAHEAGVETAAPYRGRGYGARAVTAWAGAVRECGWAALYSTSWRNGGSRALARKLGLQLFGTDLHIT